jgi:hypothetical protein
MFKRMILIGAIAALPAVAQTAGTFEKKIEQNVMFIGGPEGGGVRHVMEFRGGTVKGAPYSAEAVTETTQALADGNKIVNKQSGKEYRDSEGRTRRDSTVQPMGPWVAEGKSSSMSMINDPVSGEHLTLHHEAKTASKMKAPTMIHDAEAGKTVQHEVHVEVRKEVSTNTVATVNVSPAPGAGAMTWTHAGLGEGGTPKVEQLGKRVIEGVECEGTKETVTIEAGKIGNDRPIEIVTERWQSPALQVDVLRKHSDPRFGETNFRLQGIVRGEQPKSLFEVPPDYKVEALYGITEDRVMQRKVKEVKE